MKLRDQRRELRQKESKELDLDHAALTKELFDLRFRSTTEKLSDPSRIRQIRREVARIKTLLAERKRDPSQEPAAKTEGDA